MDHMRGKLLRGQHIIEPWRDARTDSTSGRRSLQPRSRFPLAQSFLLGTLALTPAFAELRDP